MDLKLRHTSGDAGPFSFPLSHTILQVKEAIYAQWPSGESAVSPCPPPHPHYPQLPLPPSVLCCCTAEGALSSEHPTSAQDLRLLYAGKFLDNAKTLRGEAGSNNHELQQQQQQQRQTQQQMHNRGRHHVRPS